MSYAKKELFETDEIDLADIAKALSHPARIKILKLLYTQNSCLCNQIVQELPLAQATVSQHLKELKRIGIIDGVLEGPAICYCLNKKKLNLMFYKFSVLFSSLTNPKTKP